MLVERCRAYFARSIELERTIASCIICLFWIAMATDAAAYECHASLPAERAGYWSWRQVEGRKCWYRGPRVVSKRSLHWPAAVTSPVTTGTNSPSPQASAPPPIDPDERDAETRLRDCCWPPVWELRQILPS